MKILRDFRKNQAAAFEGMWGKVERVEWCPVYGCYVYFVRLLAVSADGEEGEGKEKENDEGMEVKDTDMEIMVASERQLHAYPPGVAVGESVVVRGEGDLGSVSTSTVPAHVPYATFTQENFQVMLQMKRNEDTGVSWSKGRWEVLSVEPVMRNFYLTYRCECEGECEGEGEGKVGGTSGGGRVRRRKWFELCDVRRVGGELGRE